MINAVDVTRRRRTGRFTTDCAALLAALVAVGCSDPVTPGGGADLTDPTNLPEPSDPPSPVEHDGLLVRSMARLGGGDEGPAGLFFDTRARNVSDEPVEFSGACVVQLRADRVGDPATTSSSSDWQRPEEPFADCASFPSEVEVPPGELHSVFEVDGLARPGVEDILGDSLPAGRYDLSVVVRIDGETVAVPAGRLHLANPEGRPFRNAERLSYSVDTEVQGAAPRELVTRVLVGNQTDEYGYVEFGHCTLLLRAYPTTHLGGSPVWRSEAARDVARRLPSTCLDYLATRLVAPGEVVSPLEFTSRMPVPEILGDSLPDGRYHFVAELTFLRTDGGGVENQVVRLPAGSAELSSAIEPLPSARRVGPILYEAEIAEREGDQIRIRVTATNQSTGPAWVVGSIVVDCGAQLWGFTTEAARDTWYLRSEPDWFSGDCSLDLDPFRLAPGQSDQFQVSYPAPPQAIEHFAIRLWLELEPEPGTAVVLVAVEP